jgi:hypothetical protein
MRVMSIVKSMDANGDPDFPNAESFHIDRLPSAAGLPLQAGHRGLL